MQLNNPLTIFINTQLEDKAMFTSESVALNTNGYNKMLSIKASKLNILSIINRVVHGGCADVMSTLPDCCIDFICTDPPYLVNYQDRSGRSLANDDNDEWLFSSFTEAYRVLKNNSLCVSFYAWNRVEKFSSCWRAVGFYPVGHIVFKKDYSSKTRYVSYQHESCFLLAKGKPELPENPIPDVLPWEYSGNLLHPTQKPLRAITTLIKTFSKQGDLILDPFCGSGTTCAAARLNGRNFIGIDIEEQHVLTATRRLIDLDAKLHREFIQPGSERLSELELEV